jgi:NAD(P)-dependent dehydrogenase (short-subunit alcohol dehydrogenase family)
VTLRGQVAIVTGAGSGIGKACAERLTQFGARVVVATLESSAQAVANELKEALFIQTDVSDSSSVQNMVNRTVEHFGRIDVLVNNAGITEFFTILEASESDYDRLVNINLKGQFLCARFVAPQMVKQRSGCIIGISSNHAEATMPGGEIYAATKAGIVAMNRAMALSLGQYGIRVMTVCPGFTIVSSYQSWIHGRAPMLNPLHANGRMGTPEDVAKLVAFLASPDCPDTLTGSVLTADGGVTARLYWEAKSKEGPREEA